MKAVRLHCLVLTNMTKSTAGVPCRSLHNLIHTRHYMVPFPLITSCTTLKTTAVMTKFNRRFYQLIHTSLLASDINHS